MCAIYMLMSVCGAFARGVCAPGEPTFRARGWHVGGNMDGLWKAPPPGLRMLGGMHMARVLASGLCGPGLRPSAVEINVVSDAVKFLHCVSRYEFARQYRRLKGNTHMSNANAPGGTHVATWPVDLSCMPVATSTRCIVDASVADSPPGTCEAGRRLSKSAED